MREITGRVYAAELDRGPAGPHDGQTVRMITVPIADDSIRLGQFLKLANLAESGAHARALLDDGAVTVNGEDETRRGRQLVKGDVVEVDLPGGYEEATVG
jgi:ribosome-associated protein